MLTLLKKAHVYAPEDLGVNDILFCCSKIVKIAPDIEVRGLELKELDARDKFVTPAFIDQHVHIIGAGGKNGFHSFTPELKIEECILAGITTCVGLLGTDGSTRSLESLYAKAKALEAEGLSTYIFSSYFGIPPLTMTSSIMNDMVFIDKVIGAKIAISDERSSFPDEKQILEYLRQIRVGGMISGKREYFIFIWAV